MAHCTSTSPYAGRRKVCAGLARQRIVVLERHEDRFRPGVEEIETLGAHVLCDPAVKVYGDTFDV